LWCVVEGVDSAVAVEVALAVVVVGLHRCAYDKVAFRCLDAFKQQMRQNTEC
uniref:Cyclin_C domain-containing protein n=1 Tax=Echinostoma caproni TaxID=27848 RepID=A0A183AQY5_9TREM